MTTDVVTNAPEATCSKHQFTDHQSPMSAAPEALRLKLAGLSGIGDDLISNDAKGRALCCWHFLNNRSIENKIRVFNPDLEKDGWLCEHTVILILSEDREFLVDSLRIELTRRGLQIHEVDSVIVDVLRDREGVLQRVSLKDAHLDEGAAEARTEALVYLEVSRHTDESDMLELTSAFRSVLRDVGTVVTDHQSLRAKVVAAGEELTRVEDKALKVNVEEARSFLKWLANGHFVLLGYCEYEFQELEGKRLLCERTDQRLGLFRLREGHDTTAFEDDLNPGMTRFHLTPQLLSFSKSSVRSRVHRHAYSDYVVVKKFDAQGRVCGEGRFLGLYTAAVYTLSPTLIPVVRQKVANVLARADLDPGSHDGKALRQIVETFPRDELFQSNESELLETIRGVAHIKERQQVRLFVRRDPYGKFVNAIVYVPRDQFNTQIRERIQHLIGAAINAQEHEFTTYFSESVLARCHIVFKVDPEQTPSIEVKRLERRIVDIARSWQDRLYDSLCETHGEELGTQLFKRYAGGFTSGYQEYFEARAAVQDLSAIDGLNKEQPLAMSFYQPMGAATNAMRFKVFHLGSTLELSDVIPVLENLGLRVLGEHPFQIKSSDGRRVWMHDFDLRFGLQTDIDVQSARQNFQDAFAAIWNREAHNDAFNRLVLGARLSWREVTVLRAYACYMKQTMFNFSQTYIANTLANHLDITRNLVALFKFTFDPRVNGGAQRDLERIDRLRQKILDSLDRVDNLNEDQIIRRYLEFIQGTLRTNFFQNGPEGTPKNYISLKFAPQTIEDIPEPRPLYEIFVYSPRVEGVHLRGGSVARGGLRWSDRLQDYRTEVLGLVKAQQVKNAVIVPSGAKGGFVAKRLPTEGGRQAQLEEGIACYQTFIRGLLDVTDNFAEGNIVAPPQVIRRDGDDPYLVVAADKGTATCSDIANQISADYDHWLGDAFASGGSVGYDHKGMGITARGAWVSVQRHFKEKGLDVQSDAFTVIGIGDMGGDVFGNGMLMSPCICLTAAFNHLHIFVDPDPDPASSFTERQRLFNDPGTTWQDYDKELISKGGGVFSRSAKSIVTTPEMKRRFRISTDRMTPTELINALLKAPVDLIWNGGIGTYVKAVDENHSDVGDKANDALRVNGSELRCRVFGEGGNLGMTQLGRIEFCLEGGACNTDFIDNAAGVDCSDHEVNIKILLDGIVGNGDLTDKQRNRLLESMTDSVAVKVLNNNYKQTQAISLAEYQVSIRVGEYRRFINHMEEIGHLDRGLEFIPEDEEILERQQKGKSLTRPELSVLISYAKVQLKEVLANEQLTDDAYIAQSVESAFPQALKSQYREQIYQHRLRKEIVATQVANDMVNHMGINFSHRLAEFTGANPVDVAKAYVSARDIYQMHGYFEAIEALDFQVDSERQYSALATMMRRMRRATRWFLRNRRGCLSPALEVEAFAAPVQRLQSKLPELICGQPRQDWESGRDKLVEQGLPEAIAASAAMPTTLYSELHMVEAANALSVDPSEVARVYFVLADRLGLHRFVHLVSEARLSSYWQAMAREAFLDDVESQIRTLAESIVKPTTEGTSLDDSLETWLRAHESQATRWQTLVGELTPTDNIDFAMVTVVLNELKDLAQNHEALRQPG
ncbi:NAD-glutamate dehydrogenase [Pseudomaricurvus alkylphenolicus]|uniref:NAD-glutamate dehydrogenase n=1 Tax=Pseudomaricurvus alkylphenolicus TaxID=1306991 RepID=UPI001420E8C7|nr:NAD-glutamate dehydrogenase [Pseudomaricurvus alkylphenolicus]NIB42652.1 NAD-glutamate dehydrogenase [Pseudomaricurvus alkylphenolicus]